MFQESSNPVYNLKESDLFWGVKNSAGSNNYMTSSQTERFGLTSSENTTELDFPLQSSIFCYNNEAAYGLCLASSFAVLQVEHLPTSRDPVYPGIPFFVAIKKLDAYNQTIITDSFSAIQAQILLNSTVIGHSVASLVCGETLLNVVVKPLFLIRPENTPVLLSQPRVRFEGIDSLSDTVSTMVSQTFQIIMANDASICPTGYTLTFDQTDDSTQKIGACVKCSEGSYSLSTRVPFCINCPVNAICSGGNSVQFLLGTWIIENGIYKLISCPPGHQLLNGGDVSFALQQCVPCQSNQYILNSNMSNYTCQNCPVGAECDGISLMALVPGSVWEPDALSGQYLLSICPPGYFLINTLQNGRFSYVNQECSLCPAFYFCTGGSNPASVCPQSQFTTPGANSSDLCSEVTVVAMAVFLPMASSEFTAQRQKSFRTALAFTSKQNLGRVVIQSFAFIHRSLASGLEVKARIGFKDPSTALALSAAFDTSTFNLQLADQDLPPCTLISISVESAILQSTGSSLDRVLIGIFIGALFLTALLLLCMYVRKRRSFSEDEKLLKQEISLLRIKLKLTQRDGFYLTSDPDSWLPWHRKPRTNIEKGHIEAAAKLSLLMDFDVDQFDAFCICLECCGSRAIINNKNMDLVNPAYSSLCAWLLEICSNILKPDILHSNSRSWTLDDSDSPACRLHPEQRFQYFLQKVSKARIWSCQTCELFQKLKDIVHDYMKEMSDLCNYRYNQLNKDAGWSALNALSNFPDEYLSNMITDFTYIRRQDHDQVVFPREQLY